MNIWFLIALIGFILLSFIMTLIILVQRPQGGGLAGAFGGASGAGTDTVFGGRVGDALTTITVVLFVCFLGLAISLSLIPSNVPPPPAITPVMTTSEFPEMTPVESGTGLPRGNVTTTPVSQDPGGPLPFEELDPSNIDPAILRDLQERVGGGNAGSGGSSTPPGSGSDN